MEAMVLAAGAGTRLGDLTDRIPKALVPVGGRPLLEWVVSSLVKAGAHRIIINTHHHDGMIREFIREYGAEGVDFLFSHEADGPYETGGGLFHAAELFEKEGPFLLHNADVLSTISLANLVARHRGDRESGNDKLIASVAVQERDSRRVLLFDDLGLVGWENRGSDRGPDGRVQVRDPEGLVHRKAFTGPRGSFTGKPSRESMSLTRGCSSFVGEREHSPSFPSTSTWPPKGG
jgi:GTP:adenosylcobinamide-phosphate guanylyltransferase